MKSRQATEDPANRRKRLLFRSEHRGMREMDMILSAFAREHLDSLDAEGLDQYELLLDHGDNDLYSWVSGRATVPEEHRTRLLDMFVHYKLDSLKT